MIRRVLHIVPTLDRAGAEKQLVLLAGGLPRGLFDVHVCAITRGGPLAAELAADRIETTVIGKALKFDPVAYLRLQRHIRRLKPDLVQTWMFTANAYGRTAARSAGVQTIVATERGMDNWKRPYHWAIDRRLARTTSKIVVNSPGVQDYLIEHGLPSEKICVIHNGIGPGSPSTLPRSELLAELALPAGSRLIGAVSRLAPGKRIEDMLGAMELLGSQHPRVCLLIVGDGPERGQLETYSRSRGLESRVRFLGFRHDVPQLMPHFDVLWLASDYEGLPNAIMEAMACGVPVVATDIAGNRELVRHGESGFLAPLDNRQAFAQFTGQILNDSRLARHLGVAGRERMSHDFTITAMVEKYAALYRELLSQ